MRRLLLLALLSLLLASCKSSEGKRVLKLGTTVGDVDVLTVEGLTENGYSGLTPAADGGFWTVAELGGLQHLAWDEPARTLRADAPPLPLVGLAPGLELESVGFLKPGLLLFGTERDEQRSSDVVLQGQVEDGHVKLLAQVLVPYDLWSIQARSNQGVEGACVGSDDVVVAIETAWVDGDRWGLLGRHDPETGAWQGYRIQLTTKTGKLSDISCRKGPIPGTIDILAIERHFDVARLLRVTLPPWDPATSLERGPATAPEVVDARMIVDLAALLGEAPSFAGVAWLGDTAWLLTDNHYGRVTGPTEAVRVRGVQ